MLKCIFFQEKTFVKEFMFKNHGLNSIMLVSNASSLFSEVDKDKAEALAAQRKRSKAQRPSLVKFTRKVRKNKLFYFCFNSFFIFRSFLIAS